MAKREVFDAINMIDSALHGQCTFTGNISATSRKTSKPPVSEDGLRCEKMHALCGPPDYLRLAS